MLKAWLLREHESMYVWEITDKMESIRGCFSTSRIISGFLMMFIQ